MKIERDTFSKEQPKNAPKNERKIDGKIYIRRTNRPLTKSEANRWKKRKEEQEVHIRYRLIKTKEGYWVYSHFEPEMIRRRVRFKIR